MNKSYQPLIVLIVVLLISACGEPTPPIPPSPTPHTPAPTQPSNQTPTGFYWPTGTSELGDLPGFLADNCFGHSAYEDDKYHIGHDIDTGVVDPVYAISAGEVFWISYNGWNYQNNSVDKNIALLIQHKLADGSDFMAVYGHIHSELKIGAIVSAGQQIGTIGPFGNAPHLHFGIRPWVSTAAPYGKMECPQVEPINDTNGFVDPIDWIMTRTPGEYLWSATATPSAIPLDTPPSLVVTDTPVTSGDASSHLIAYVGADRGIWTMNADGTNTRRLTDSDGYSYIHWSPDGTQMAFTYIEQPLKIIMIDADGSHQIEIPFRPSRLNYFSDLSWSPDGQSLAFGSTIEDRYDIFTVNNEGDNLTNITLYSRSGYIYFPSWSPDGTRMAFLSNKPSWSLFDDLYVMNFSDQDWINLTNIPDNELQGGIVHSNVAFPTNLRWSPNSDFITFTGLAQGSDYCGMMGAPEGCREITNLFLATADGRSLTNLTGPRGSENRYAWSPDGTKIAFETNRDGNWEIYLISPDGSDLVNLTRNPADDSAPSWSPDGKSLVFISNRDGNQEIYRMDLESRLLIRLTNSEGDESIPVYQPVGSVTP